MPIATQRNALSAGALYVGVENGANKCLFCGFPDAFYIEYFLPKSANSYVKGLPKIRPENAPTSYVKRDREM